MKLMYQFLTTLILISLLSSCQKNVEEVENKIHQKHIKKDTIKILSSKQLKAIEKLEGQKIQFNELPTFLKQFYPESQKDTSKITLKILRGNLDEDEKEELVVCVEVSAGICNLTHVYVLDFYDTEWNFVNKIETCIRDFEWALVKIEKGFLVVESHTWGSALGTESHSFYILHQNKLPEVLRVFLSGLDCSPLYLCGRINANYQFKNNSTIHYYLNYQLEGNSTQIHLLHKDCRITYQWNKNLKRFILLETSDKTLASLFQPSEQHLLLNIEYLQLYEKELKYLSKNGSEIQREVLEEYFREK